MTDRLRKQLVSIRKILVESLDKDFVPFPVDRRFCSGWTKDLPYGGETVIFTSFMYQLSALFKSYEKHLSTFSSLGGSTKLASLGKFLMKPKRSELERSYAILRNISRMLKNSGIEHGYLYDDEPYSGGLLLELGMLDEFKDYTKKMFRLFEEKGVKKLITVDPHTTNAVIRAKAIHNSSIEVVNYLGLIRNTQGNGRFVLHDPCLYTRYNDLGEVMRSSIRNSGVELVEDIFTTSRSYGTCCGGPLGTVDYGLSEKIAENRSKQLKSLSQNVLVACPLCYENLYPHIEKIKDISEVLK